jgi:tRNA1(Val) A37 N6-methylase TrmN6
MIHAYFEDLHSMLRNMRRCLTEDGQIVIVVGDSSYAGVRIDCAGILCETAQALGLAVAEKKSARVMRSSMQQGRGEKVLDEWLIRFRRLD